jgi:beta-galactosidase
MSTKLKRTLGVCYYPEHWDEAQWEKDAARMAALGLTWVRIGEFAWSQMEPEPGRLDFDWLDRAIATLGVHGLKVVLGTPTATPPRWMADRHPDMFALDKDGRPRGFGSRRHYCFSHQGYRAECARIVTLLAQRHGRNPHVAAWQTDNEYACHATTLSYSNAARAAFQDWLAQKYQSPDALNRAWGNVFWSMEYRDFREVGLPNLTVTEPNPSHVMDFRRFASDEVVSFNRLQTDIIRRHSSYPIAHNYMGAVTEFDHYAVGADLDIASWDSYPLGFLSDRIPADPEHKRRFLRQGDPDFQAFHHDLYRTVGARRSGGQAAGGRWWIMEQQPGPVNWAPYNPDPLPGMARLWAWEAFAHGAEAVCYFRWRQAPFAQEQMHAGLLRPDSAPAQAFAEAGQVANELAEMPEAGTARADVGLIFDYASDWAWETQAQGRGFSHFWLVFHVYKGLRRLGLNVDILPPDTADLSAYKLVLAPGLFTLSDPLKAALAAHRGTAILGPRTNSKTPNFSIPVPLPPALPGLDAVVARVESLPPDVPVPLAEGGAFRHWREKLEGKATVVETAEDGWPALVSGGRLHYLAGWPDEVALNRILLRASAAEGIGTDPLPEGLRQRDTASHRFLFNYNPVPVDWGGVIIPPAGVHWTKR